VALYESLRADIIAVRVRAEAIAALRFHGMLQGLAILLKVPAAASPIGCVPVGQPLPRDHAFVRVLANLVLQTHAEVTHVC
jgi:hypothetical protein